MKQDTGKLRKNTKEQFYTSTAVASACVARIRETIAEHEDYLWLEPAAGDGVFLRSLPASFNRFGTDIEPKSDDVVAGDYLLWEPPDSSQDIIVFGNPPFGRRSSLAKAFITKSCRFAKVIAFILPRSFTKPSMFNAFSSKFHMIHCEELPDDSFLIDGEPYHVPCVFQIWEKHEVDRPCVAKTPPVGYRYARAGEDFHVAFRRVGALAGKCYPNNGTSYSSQTHYFIHLDDCYSTAVDDIISRVNEHVFPSNTVGPRSISKSEACEVINKILSEKT